MAMRCRHAAVALPDRPGCSRSSRPRREYIESLVQRAHERAERAHARRHRPRRASCCSRRAARSARSIVDDAGAVDGDQGAMKKDYLQQLQELLHDMGGTHSLEDSGR